MKKKGSPFSKEKMHPLAPFDLTSKSNNKSERKDKKSKGNIFSKLGK